MATPSDFLTALWGDGPHSLCWKTSDDAFHSGQFFDTPTELLAAAERLDGCDVWFGANPLRRRPSSGRGRNSDVGAVVCLHADLDWADSDAHRTDKYMSEAEVKTAVNGLPLSPSFVVHSGHGLQAYWLLAEPLGPASRAEANDGLREMLTAAGLHPERLDPASILRVPDTTNYKAAPIPVRLSHADVSCTYTITDFAEYAPDRPSPEPAPTGPSQHAPTADSPAVIYKNKYSIEDELTRSGWAEVRGGWRHPTASHPVSGTLTHNGDAINVFSTSPDLAALSAVGRAFRGADTEGFTATAFDLFCAREHDGSVPDAYRALGSGERERQAGPVVEVDPASGMLVEAEGGAGGLMEPIDWSRIDEAGDDIIEGLAIPGRWTALAAKAKQGKSTVTVYASVQASLGIDPWTGEQMDPVTVLYLDAEMGRLDLRERVREVGHEPAALDRWHGFDLPPILNQPEGAAQLLRTVEHLSADLVVIDGLNGTIVGAEKDDEVWRNFFNLVIAPLKRMGVAIISADNLGKDATLGPRGSSVKMDKADAVIEVSRTDSGTRLKTSLRRTTAYPLDRSFRVTGLDDAVSPIVFRHAVGHDDPKGTKEMIAVLDALGVPEVAGREKCSAALRKAQDAAAQAGSDATRFQARTEVLAAAVRARKARARHGSIDDLIGPGLREQVREQVSTAARNCAREQVGENGRLPAPEQVREQVGTGAQSHGNSSGVWRNGTPPTGPTINDPSSSPPTDSAPPSAGLTGCPVCGRPAAYDASTGVCESPPYIGCTNALGSPRNEASS